jgi:glycosyltransferase involved in cell wall biosynthesis
VILTVEERFVEKQYLQQDNKLDKWGLSNSVIRTRQLPHPFDLYRFAKRLFSSALTNGVTIEPEREAMSRHAFSVPESGSGFRHLLLSSLSFPDAYTGWILPAIISGWRAIRRTKAQVIFSSAPCWTNHLVAYCLSRLTGLPWVAHLRDPFITGSHAGVFLTDFERRIAHNFERMVFTRASRVIAVTEEHCAMLRSAYHQMPADKFVAVPNGFDGEDWEGFDKLAAKNSTENNGRREKFRITYAGKLYMKRNPLPLFRALRELIDSREISRKRVQVDLIGWCELSEGRSIADLIVEMGLQDIVNIAGTLSHSETLQRLAQSDLLLLLAEELTLQIPGKTFEYLKAGCPILALTPEGAVSKLLRQTRGGWAVAASDHTGIVAAVRECYQSWESGLPGRAPDPSVVASFDRRLTTKQIAESFDSIVPIELFMVSHHSKGVTI